MPKLLLALIAILFASAVFAADTTTVVPITCGPGQAITAINARGVATCTTIVGGSPPASGALGVAIAPSTLIYDPTTSPFAFWQAYQSGGKQTSYAVPGAGAVYVSTTGNDTTGDGSIGNPYKRISHVIYNHCSTGMTVVVRGGVYRGEHSLTSCQLTVQPYLDEIVEVPGTLLTTAKEWTADGSQWRYDTFTFYIPECDSGMINSSFPNASGAVVLLSDDTPNYRKWTRLTRVATKAAATAGKFYWDKAAQKLYIGDDPNTANRRVEIPYFIVGGSVTNFIYATEKLTVKGLYVRGFSQDCDASNANAAIVGNTPNVTSENTLYAWNGNRGLQLFGSGATPTNDMVKENLFFYNGSGGVGGFSANNSTIQKNYFYGNNSERFLTGGPFADGGNKFASTSNARIWGNVFDHDEANGFWCDTSCFNFVFARNVARFLGGATGAGVFYEASGPSGSAVIAGNLSYKNAGGCMAVSGSANTRVWNNTCVQNGTAGLAADPEWAGDEWVNNIASDTNANLSGTDYNTLFYAGPNGLGEIARNDFNIYHRTSSASPATAIHWSGVAYSTLASYQSASCPPCREVSSVARDNVAASTIYSLNQTTGVYSIVAAGIADNTGTALPSDIASLLGVAASPVDIGYLP